MQQPLLLQRVTWGTQVPQVNFVYADIFYLSFPTSFSLIDRYNHSLSVTNSVILVIIRSRKKESHFVAMTVFHVQMERFQMKQVCKQDQIYLLWLRISWFLCKKAHSLIVVNADESNLSTELCKLFLFSTFNRKSICLYIKLETVTPCLWSSRRGGITDNPMNWIILNYPCNFLLL